MATKKTNSTKKPAAAKARRTGKAAETILSAVNARTGNGLVVTGSNGSTVVVTSVDGTVQKLAAIGKPLAALQDYLASRPKPQAKMARGAEGKMTEHSRKAVADQKSTAKGRKARGDAAAVAGKSAPKAKSGGKRGYDAAAKLTVLVKPKDSKLAAGSGRLAKLELATKCKTVGDFIGKVVKDASGKEHKCDAGALSGMLKRQHVRLG